MIFDDLSTFYFFESKLKKGAREHNYEQKNEEQSALRYPDNN
jgi:hypothetical protein